MADAQDVTQDVLIRLARVMLTFEYDPAGGFRKWLKQVTRNAVADFFRDLRRKPDSPAWANDPQLLNEVSTDSDLSERLQEAFDLELFELAVDRVKERIDERRWRAWHLFAIDKWTVADISVELNMKVQSVYSSRYQVQALISEEVQKLEESESRSLLIRLPPSGST